MRKNDQDREKKTKRVEQVEEKNTVGKIQAVQPATYTDVL